MNIFRLLLVTFLLLPAMATAQGFIQQTTTSAATGTGTTTTEASTTNVSINNALSSQEEPQKEVTFEVENVTQDKDATNTQNLPGDLLKLTMSLENKGPGSLILYKAAVSSEELFKLSRVQDADDVDGRLEQNRSFLFDAETVRVGSLQEWELELKLNNTMCLEHRTLAENGAIVQFEDEVLRLQFNCAATGTTSLSSATTTTATTTVVNAREASTFETSASAAASEDENVMPPKTPDTGPEMLLFLFLLSGVITWFVLRKEEHAL